MTDTRTIPATERIPLGIKVAHGGAMMVHLTELADRQGVLTYLSTTDPKTVPFYKKYGFQVISETNSLGISNYHLVRKPTEL